jgi:glutathione S-transferase
VQSQVQLQHPTFLHHISFLTNSNTPLPPPQTAAEQEKAKKNMLGALKAISAAYEGSGGPFFLGPKPSYADFHWFPWAHRCSRQSRIMLNSGYHLTRALQRRLGVLEHYRNFSVPTTPEFAGDACDIALSITARKMSCKRVM